MHTNLAMFSKQFFLFIHSNINFNFMAKTKKKVAKATKVKKEKSTSKTASRDLFKRKAFATWFNALMVKDNLSFRGASAAMGLTNPTIAKATKGEELSLQSYAAICRYGKVSLDKFIV